MLSALVSPRAASLSLGGAPTPGLSRLGDFFARVEALASELERTLAALKVVA